ncbi:hypothetical protein ERO13_A03G085101v2 [Gossypium hirsutum]|nr:hypothetical protein ERO13_A03G085101v2 [Gossypium hirsutum]
MLPSSSHVLNVYNGPGGLLQGGDLLTPQLFIDSSTIDPQTSRKLAVSVSNCILKERKVPVKPVMLDAPVSGGVVAAEAGSLTFMVGGSEDVYLAAKSLLLSMGKTQFSVVDEEMVHDSYNPVPGVMQGVPSSRNYSGGFASKLMAKDLNLAAASAEEVGQRCPLTFLAQNIRQRLL